MATEVLFSSIESDIPNIQEAILKSILKVNMLDRSLICSNILITGGIIMMPGIFERIQDECN